MLAVLLWLLASHAAFMSQSTVCGHGVSAMFTTSYPARCVLALFLAGALFISYTIKTFGALIFATIMTTRQFVSILLSCILFAHPLTAGQG